MMLTVAAEREFRELKGHTEVGATWSDEDIEKVTKFLPDVPINRMRMEF